MSEHEGEVSEVQNLERADEPISPGDYTAGNPVDEADADHAGPDAVPEGNTAENEYTEDEDEPDEEE